jgi:hypothetical protein
MIREAREPAAFPIDTGTPQQSKIPPSLRFCPQVTKTLVPNSRLRCVASGAYYGRKRDAKHESGKRRRRDDAAEVQLLSAFPVSTEGNGEIPPFR